MTRSSDYLNDRYPELRELGPDELILSPEEIALEDAPEPVGLGDLEDGHLENDDYRKRHPDAE